MHNSLATDLYRALPLKRDQMTLRLCTRADLDLLASWPPYPWPYQVFDFSFRSHSPSERDAFFVDQIQGDDRITLVCDRGSDAAIGYIAPLRIDWHSRIAENLSLRVHPDQCGKGIGMQMLEIVSEWWFGCGMQGLQLDVAATNQRAVRCYLKAGFACAGEFWREAPDLQNVDIDDARYDFLREHLRDSGPVPEMRFFWMRRTGAQMGQYELPALGPAPCARPGMKADHRQGD